MTTIDITTIQDFITAVQSCGNLRKGGSFFFRGECADFKTTSCLPSIYRKPQWIKRERYFYNEILHRFPQYVKDLDNVGRLVFMQHYGFPTRLLDVSESPLIALYFAVCDKKQWKRDGYVYCIKVPYRAVHYENYDNIAAILTLVDKDIKDDIDNNILNKVIFIKPSWQNERIRAQQGQVLLFGCDQTKEKPTKLQIAEQSDEPYIHLCLKIPYKHKEEIYNTLQNLGIREWTLFPDPEHLALELKEKKVVRAIDKNVQQ